MLSTNQMKKAQANYTRYAVFNVLSYTFMAGNVVLLYAMRLGAGTRLVGILSAFNSITFVFSLLGRMIVPRLGYVKTMGYFWLLRYLVMVPVLFTLIPSLRAHSLYPLLTISIGVFGFNFLKGVALASTNPIIGYITRNETRAAFLANNNMINFAGQIVTGITIALLLGADAPLYKYPLFIMVGIIAGVFAALSILKLPEQERPPQTELSLIKSIRETFKSEGFPRFITLVILSTVVTGMSGGFLILYCKNVYFQSDGVIIFFTVAGAAGSLIMTRFARFITDRVGAKPMYFTFHILQIICLIPILISPVLPPSRLLFLFLCLLFFFNQMMIWGLGYSADIYFFSITREEDRLDQSVVYNIIRGISGMLGALGGGFLLSFLENRFPASEAQAFQIYYALPVLILAVNMLMINKLPDKGKYSITDVLGIIFNPRDLKAIYYLNKLDKTTSAEDEREIVSAMGTNKSPLNLDELYNRLNSPSFFVRAEALNSLKKYPLTEQTESYLINDLTTHPFTTAHISAEIIGNHRIERAEKALGTALDSPDYLLVSKAAVALGQLGARDWGDKILNTLESTENPRIIMFCAKALELLGKKDAIPSLLRHVEVKTYPHLTDDLIMNTATLLEFNEWFFPLFLSFLEKPHKAIHELRQEIEEGPWSEDLHHLVRNRDVKDFYSGILEHFDNNGTVPEEAERLEYLLSFMREADKTEPSDKIRFLINGFLVYLSGKAERGQSHPSS